MEWLEWSLQLINSTISFLAAAYWSSHCSFISDPLLFHFAEPDVLRKLPLLYFYHSMQRNIGAKQIHRKMYQFRLLLTSSKIISGHIFRILIKEESLFVYFVRFLGRDLIKRKGILYLSNSIVGRAFTLGPKT